MDEAREREEAEEARERVEVDEARERVVVAGWGDKVMFDCAVQESCRGYVRDAYNDECEECVEMKEDSIQIRYGDHVMIRVMGFRSEKEVEIEKEALAFSYVTVYFDVEKEGDWNALQEGRRSVRV